VVSIESHLRDLARRDPAAATDLLRRTYAADLDDFLGAKLPVSAREDAAQQVWLAVLRGVGGFTGVDAGGRPVLARTWLFAIAKHKRADFLRQRARFEPLEDALTRLVESSRKSPSRQLLSHEERRELEKLIGRLDPAERRLLEWRYVEGFMPETWLDHVEQEGCARELGIDREMADLAAAPAEECARIGKRLKDRLMKRLSRVVLQIVETWAAEEARAAKPGA
jgi:RNA polymerase sigma factor (sigma-70 family)